MGVLRSWGGGGGEGGGGTILPWETGGAWADSWAGEHSTFCASACLPEPGPGSTMQGPEGLHSCPRSHRKSEGRDRPRGFLPNPKSIPTEFRLHCETRAKVKAHEATLGAKRPESAGTFPGSPALLPKQGQECRGEVGWG